MMLTWTRVNESTLPDEVPPGSMVAWEPLDWSEWNPTQVLLASHEGHWTVCRLERLPDTPAPEILGRVRIAGREVA